MFAHGIVGTVLEYFNCHKYCLCWVIFMYVDKLAPGSNSFVACSQRLVVASCYYHHSSSVNYVVMVLPKGRRNRKLAIRLAYWQGQCTSVRHNAYEHTLYLRCEDTILAIQCMDLPILKVICLCILWITSLKWIHIHVLFICSHEATRNHMCILEWLSTSQKIYKKYIIITWRMRVFCDDHKCIKTS